MRRQWRFAAGGVIAAAAFGAYLHWLHDWRPSCSNVPSAAAAAEWLNGLAGTGEPFKPDFVACAVLAAFYQVDRDDRIGRDQYPIPGIGIHYRTPPRAEDFAKLKDLPRLVEISFMAAEAERGYADAVVAALAQSKTLRVFEWKFGEGLTDAGMRRLGGIATLEALDLTKSTLGEGVTDLAKLPRLRELKLWNSKVSAAGLARFADLKEVTRIGFHVTEVEGSLAPIARMPALQRLLISFRDLTDAQVASLAGAPELRVLEIYDSSTGPAGFAAIGSMPKLRTLFLRNPASVSGIEKLASSATLTNLLLIEAKKLDDGVGASLSAIRTLKVVDLTSSKISDAIIAALADLPSLERLWLVETPITDEALRLLAKAPQLAELHIGATAVTDAGLAHLASYPKLRKVYAGGTKVTDAGIAKLKAAKSDLDLVR